MGKETNTTQVKNENQYESLRSKGMSKETAARIANTANSGMKGSQAKSYEERSRNELYQVAKKVGIDGRSKMDKDDLIKALRNH